MADEILCVAATRASARVLAGKLAAEGGKASGIEVLTSCELARDILSAPRAAEFTGRSNRVLGALDERFLSEDMQVSTYKRRLRRDLETYLRGGLANLSDEDPRWASMGEERGYLELLRANLAFTGGMLEEEASNFAVRFLESGGQARRWKHVLVDDFTCASRASQKLCGLVARETIAIAFDEGASLEVGERFCCRDGAREFLEAHPSASASTLPAASKPETGFEPFPTAKAEFEGITEIIGNALASGVPAERVLVTGTNAQWRRQAARTLAAAGVPLESQLRRQPVKGDLRDTRIFGTTREETLRRLADDPRDGLAWRRWLGFGDYLGRSSQLARLRERAGGRTLVDALDALASGEISEDGSCKELAELYRLGLEKLQGACGNAAAESKPRPSAGVSVCSPEGAFSRSFDLVVFGGFMNGFIPAHDWFDPGALVGRSRERARERDLQRLRLVCGRTGGRVVFTAFERCTLELAERLGLRIHRIRAKDGRRICELEPSIYLDGLLRL